MSTLLWRHRWRVLRRRRLPHRRVRRGGLLLLRLRLWKSSATRYRSEACGLVARRRDWDGEKRFHVWVYLCKSKVIGPAGQVTNLGKEDAQ